MKCTPPQADWMNPAGKAMGNFIVAVDPKGELAYASPTVEKKGRPAAHVIEALTEQASPEYLAYLHRLGVSYLFAGKDRLDCALLLQKLYHLFGIEKLMLAGGGIVNGSFLAEGLVDELSLSSLRSWTAARRQFLHSAGFLPSWPPAAFHLEKSGSSRPGCAVAALHPPISGTIFQSTGVSI